jgi:hypothetical protein
MTLEGALPASALLTVMPALGAGMHVFRAFRLKDVDGRNKSGHDA